VTEIAMIQSQIVDLILDRLVDHLKLNLQDNVPGDDKSRVDVVKKGLIVSEKTSKNIQLGIQGGDHEDPDMEDGIETLQKLPEIGLFYAPREIGGGQVWVRRGVVKIEAFFIAERYDEITAYKVAYNVLGRTISFIDTTPINGLRDDFGESAITLHAYASTFHQSGGPPASYIFRGKVKWVCFTEKL